jgi:hypothetical protein
MWPAARHSKRLVVPPTSKPPALAVDIQVMNVAGWYYIEVATLRSES